jgi:hypothetical protein
MSNMNGLKGDTTTENKRSGTVQVCHDRGRIKQAHRWRYRSLQFMQNAGHQHRHAHAIHRSKSASKEKMAGECNSCATETTEGALRDTREGEQVRGRDTSPSSVYTGSYVALED